tara:strand:- start:3 stop:500 length:498 start_codon:yes stop_codon:yes gene_type:complete
MEAVELKAHQPTNREAEIITQKRTGKMFLDKVVHEVKQGNIPSLFAALQIKQLEKEFKSALTQIEELAKEELVGTGVYRYGDYQIKAREGSRTVDYSECEEVTIMQSHLDEMKAYLKQALIGVEKGSTKVEPDHHFACKLSGEIKKLPKWKYNKSSIVLTKIGRG